MAADCTFTYHRLLASTDLTTEDVMMFGRHNTLELTESPAPPSATALWMDQALYITGGRSEGEGSYDLGRLLRLTAADHRRLIDLVRSYDTVFCSVEGAGSHSSHEGTHFSPHASVWDRFLRISPSLGLAGAPFLVAGRAFAQCKDPGTPELDASDYDVGTNYSAVDFGKITSDEGGDATQGYVPIVGGKTDPNSGVTIAGGLDLGQQNTASLQAMGIDPTLVQQFQPFLGLTGQDAVNALNNPANNATISSPQAAQIDASVYDSYTNKVAAAFNSAAQANGSSTTFGDLSLQWQTVIASMYLQSQKIPSTQFFQQVTTGNFSAALQNLQNFGSPTPAQNTRAKHEADYLVKQGCTTGT